MPHRTRRLVTALVAIGATLGFVGVSAALEGEDPTLGEPEVTCPDVSDGATDDGTVTDEATDDTTVTDEGTDDATDDAVTDEATDGGDDCEEPAATDGEDLTEDGTDDGSDDGSTDDGAAPETSEVENHGAAVSQAAHDCPPGPDHGPCVRDVARSDVGKTPKGDDDSVEDESAETGDGDTDVEAEGDDATAGAGKGHGGGNAKHGR